MGTISRLLLLMNSDNLVPFSSGEYMLCKDSIPLVCQGFDVNFGSVGFLAGEYECCYYTNGPSAGLEFCHIWACTIIILLGVWSQSAARWVSCGTFLGQVSLLCLCLLLLMSWSHGGVRCLWILNIYLYSLEDYSSFRQEKRLQCLVML